MNDDNKPRVGVLTDKDGDYRVVWLNDDGTKFRDWSCDGWIEPFCTSTLTPYDEWTPPVEDGVWWCRHSDGCAVITIFAKNGRLYSDDGDPASRDWIPVERLGNLPTGWKPRQ